jgi:hypothetical protein
MARNDNVRRQGVVIGASAGVAIVVFLVLPMVMGAIFGYVYWHLVSPRDTAVSPAT